MQLSVARCAKAQTSISIALVALAGGVVAQPAQPDERDAVIQELRQRIEALERKLEERAPPAAPPPPVTSPPPPVAAPAPAPAPPKPTASEQAAREDEGARALERTLVREGGLVLPRGVIEVEPRLQYTYSGSQGISAVSVGGLIEIVQQDIRRNELEASVGIRMGLPASFQADVRVPYAGANENRAIPNAVSDSERVSGWGDVELGLTKQILVERRGGLLASLFWKSASGRHELGRLSPGSGFPHLQAALTAVRREDPLVYFASATYTRVFEREKSGSEVDPGDAIGLRAGTLLAASPETSLRAAFELSRTGRTAVAGVDVPGTDATLGILELGLATLVTRRTLLDIHLGIGVTADAPDFRLRLALPIRF
jgi:hypothetical protein